MNEASTFLRRHRMGTGKKQLFQITEAAHACGLSRSTLMRMEEKGLRDLQRSVEEMRLRATEPPSTSVQMMTLPAVTCCMRWSTGLTTADRYADMYGFYNESPQAGMTGMRAPCAVNCRRTG